MRHATVGEKQSTRRGYQDTLDLKQLTENAIKFDISLLVRSGQLGLLSSGISLGRLLGGLLLGGFLFLEVSGKSLGLSTIRRGPESEVVAKKLHDEGAVMVGLFRERIELGNSVIECLLSKVASTVRRVENLVVEDREVEGKP